MELPQVMGSTELGCGWVERERRTLWRQDLPKEPHCEGLDLVKHVKARPQWKLRLMRPRAVARQHPELVPGLAL